MLDEQNGTASNPEINIAMRGDCEVVPYARRNRDLSFCCYFHGITIACITLRVKSPTFAFTFGAERDVKREAWLCLFYRFPFATTSPKGVLIVFPRILKHIVTQNMAIATINIPMKTIGFVTRLARSDKRVTFQTSRAARKQARGSDHCQQIAAQTECRQ
jgi:hypothetical protein